MNLRRTEPAAVVVPARAATRSLRRDVADVLLVVLIDAALAGVYLLRGAARVRLWYLRPAAGRPDLVRDAEVAPSSDDTAAGGFSGDIVDEWGSRMPSSNPMAALLRC